MPIDDEFFINNIAGRSDAEAAQNLFPDWPLEKGLKFLEDKDVKYRRYTNCELLLGYLIIFNEQLVLCKVVDGSVIS